MGAVDLGPESMDLGEARLLSSCLGWRMGPLPGMSILKISGEKRKGVVRNKRPGTGVGALVPRGTEGESLFLLKCKF